jgi:hypothetical protein
MSSEPATEEYVITTAPESHATDLGRRRRKYIISMSIRLICVVLLFLVPKGWWSILIAIGAVVIPYVAVVDANAGAEMVSQGGMANYSDAALPAAPETEGEGEETPRTDGPDSPEDQIIVIEPERS